jgi:hypothetical protein
LNNFRPEEKQMKRRLLLISFLFIVTKSFSQELSLVIFSGGSTLSSFSFRTDQDIIIRISEEGKVTEWGNDPGPGRYYNDPRRLQPYLGRVEYFGQEYDSVLRGKIKSIGTCTFTYYDKYETAAKIGKLKTIGRLAVDYYDNYEDASLKGKLKLAGSFLFSYYSSFENEAFRGKLKSINNNIITYYSTFDDKAFKGRIKSIGSFEYVWYSSYDRYQGGLKYGSVIQNVGGITYIIM